MLEEDSTDGDAVLEDCRVRAAGERGIQDRRPSSGAAGSLAAAGRSARTRSTSGRSPLTIAV